MKVLWFTGVTPPALTGGKTMGGYWQEGLRSAFEQYHPDLELGIASIGNKDYEEFTQGNTTYFNVFRARPEYSRVSAIIQSWRPYQFEASEASRYQTVINKFKPHLVVSYGTENPFIKGLKELDVPLLVDIQGSVEQITGHYFDGVNTSELMNLFFSKNFLMGRSSIQRYLYLKSYIPHEREFFQYCQNYSGRTQWDKNLVMANCKNANYYHCDRVLNPVFNSNEWLPQETNEVRLYSTCSNAIFKGGLTLVKSLKLLKDRGHSNIKLHLSGIDRDSETGKLIARYANHENLTEQITFLGRIPQPQIIDEIKNCTIYVSPSHIENSPNSLGEAMMMGAPCVASNAGGTTSMIEHEYEGLVYDHKNYGELANCIEQLIRQPEFAKKLGQQARKTAVKRHDPMKISGEMYNIYQEVINQ